MKTLITYKQFLLEKDDKTDDKTDIMKKLFVDDSNNPLDKTINSILERFNKKTDIYIKTDEGKEIYTAKMYRQLKAVDLEEIIIQKKNEYFIQKKKEQSQSGQTNGTNGATVQATGQAGGQADGQATNDNYHYINEGFLKKMFDFALKKTKLFAAKLKVSKKIDPIFDASKQEIEKLFNDKNMVESYEKANSDYDKLVKKLEAESKELKKNLEITTKALETELNKKSQAESGKNAFKKDEIYTYKNNDGNAVRVVVVQEVPLKVVVVSTDNEKEIKKANPLKIKNIKDNVFAPESDNISTISDKNIDGVHKHYNKQIEYVKNKENWKGVDKK
jgi:hypothetical protein